MWDFPLKMVSRSWKTCKLRVRVCKGCDDSCDPRRAPKWLICVCVCVTLPLSCQKVCLSGCPQVMQITTKAKRQHNLSRKQAAAAHEKASSIHLCAKSKHAILHVPPKVANIQRQPAKLFLLTFKPWLIVIPHSRQEHRVETCWERLSQIHLKWPKSISQMPASWTRVSTIPYCSIQCDLSGRSVQFAH